jgi:hypothetical protein
MLKRLSVGIQKQYITASERRKDFHHLLRLRPKAGQHLNCWRQAAQYLEAGVKFKKRDYDKLVPHTLRDIRFHKGVIDNPCILTDEYSATLFRNLTASL